MGYQVYENASGRDCGYGVPAECDHPGCGEEIDRGLAYVCGNEPDGGNYGCGLYFCGEHLHRPGAPWTREEGGTQFCERCSVAVEAAIANDDGGYELPEVEPFTPTADVSEWVTHKLMDPSWAEWRADRPAWVKAHQQCTEALAAFDAARDLAFRGDQ